MNDTRKKRLAELGPESLAGALLQLTGHNDMANDLVFDLNKLDNYGVRYLKKLDRLASDVDDWKNVAGHQTYVQELRQTHGLKSAFWAKYGDP